MAFDRKKQFDKDLLAGEASERLIAKKLKKLWKAKDVSFNKTKHFDIVFSFTNGTEKTVEVKTDFLAGTKYQNSFLEVACSGKPSGLATTTAHIYVIYVPFLNKAYSFPPKEMLGYLYSIEGAKHRKVNGGDQGRASGHLLPLSVLENLIFVEEFLVK